MKKFASIAAILAVGLSVSFVSCNKDEQKGPSRISYTGTPVTGTQLAFKSDGNNVTKYYWDFGDSTFSDQATPSHSYAKPGNYKVLLMLNGLPSTVSWKDITIHKDPVHTKKIGTMWRWSHREHDVRYGWDAFYNDTSFAITFLDALNIAVDGGRDTLVYDDVASTDTILVFGRTAHGHDMPDTAHNITFYPTLDSIIYTISPCYFKVKVAREHIFRTKKK